MVVKDLHISECLWNNLLCSSCAVFFMLFLCIPSNSMFGKQTLESVLVEQALSRKEQLLYVQVEADISITVNDVTNTANCLMQMAGRDSLSMEITGPFGISVARLFSDKEYFLFHDILQSRAIEGKPSREQLSEVTFMPLSFEDYASLFRAEPPGDARSFTLVDTFSDSSKVLYKRSTDPLATEFVLCNKANGTIIEYQRKNKKGIVELSMKYDNYSMVNNIFMPSIVVLSSPSRGLSMKVSAQSIIVNSAIPTTMRFSLPSSITPLRMD